MLHEELLHEMNREQASEIAAEVRVLTSFVSISPHFQTAFTELRSNRTNEHVQFRCGEIMRHKL